MLNELVAQRPNRTSSRSREDTFRGPSEVLVPAELPVAGLARDRHLGILLDLLHGHAVLLHLGEAGGRADRVLVGGLTRELAVGVARVANVIALERVEVVVRARRLRVPLGEDRLLGVEVPDLASEAAHRDLRDGAAARRRRDARLERRSEANATNNRRDNLHV